MVIAQISSPILPFVKASAITIIYYRELSFFHFLILQIQIKRETIKMIILQEVINRLADDRQSIIN